MATTRPECILVVDTDLIGEAAERVLVSQPTGVKRPISPVNWIQWTLFPKQTKKGSRRKEKLSEPSDIVWQP